ncbi:MAG: hypothetical protein J5760_06195 [Clostridia bacterium]|nr:hypothetical protein [Clostridia bacterium]
MKRTIALLLSAVLILAAIPFSVLAGEETVEPFKAVYTGTLVPGETTTVSFYVDSTLIKSCGFKLDAFDGLGFVSGSWVKDTFRIPAVEDPDPDDDGDYITPFMAISMKVNESGAVDAATMTYSPEDGEQLINGLVFKLKLTAGTEEGTYTARVKVSYSGNDANNVDLVFDLPFVVAYPSTEESSEAPGSEEPASEEPASEEPASEEPASEDVSEEISEDPVYTASAYVEYESDVNAGDEFVVTVYADADLLSCGLAMQSIDSGLSFIKGSWVNSAFKTPKVANPDPDDDSDWISPTISKRMELGETGIDSAVVTYASEDGVQHISGQVFKLTLKANAGTEGAQTAVLNFVAKIGDDNVADISLEINVNVIKAEEPSEDPSEDPSEEPSEEPSGSELPALEGLSAPATVSIVAGKNVVISIHAENTTVKSLGIGVSFDESFEFVKGSWNKNNIKAPLVANPDPEDDSDWIAPTLTTNMSKGENGKIDPAALAFSASDGAQPLNGDIFKLTLKPAADITGEHVVTFVINGTDNDDKPYTTTIEVTVGGHTHDWVLESETPGTCTAKGSKHYVCACGESYDEETTTDPDNHVHTELRNAKEGDCGNDGYTGDLYCTDCGALIESGSVILATGDHDYGVWTVSVSPTEEAAGERKHVCSVCGHEESETIPALSVENGYTVVEKSAPSAIAEGVKEWTHEIYGVFETAIPRLEAKLSVLLDDDYIIYEIGGTQYVIIRKAASELPAGVVVRSVAGAAASAADQTFGYVLNVEVDGEIKDTAMIALLGDVNGDGIVNSADAIYLLRYTLFAAEFPINQSGDVNGDGVTNSADAIYLLRYTLFASEFPLAYPAK